ncbi:MAG: hypothetical protein ISQ65_07710 [Pseudomonadales bacterium]|nr:hypothetical protein [Pseudomonadales bacterium]
MSLPVNAPTQASFSDNSVTRTHLVAEKLSAPKTFVGRGTYEGLGEGLGGSASVVKQADQGQTGQGLRESLAARNKELSAAARMARTNTLVSQAGLPAGLNKAVDRSTADVLAVRMQRQDFMRALVR